MVEELVAEDATDELEAVDKDVMDELADEVDGGMDEAVDGVAVIVFEPI